MAILDVKNLSKIYGKGENRVVALDNINLSVKEGEFISIIGSSGSGKSTLLHLLGGVDYPTEGTVTINGTDIYSLSPDNLAIFRRRQVGLVYQFYNLISVLNVVDNMTLPLELDSQKIPQTYLEELLHTLQLTQRKKHLPHQLSGGQQQRVSIGRALMNKPAIFLADEPTGNLDSDNSKEIIALLKLANQKYNQTIIVITHDLDIAMQANRVITLKDGKIVKDEVIRV